MATISTEVRMTLTHMTPLVAALARRRFGDIEDAVIDTRDECRRFPFNSHGNRHARRAAAARARMG